MMGVRWCWSIRLDSTMEFWPRRFGGVEQFVGTAEDAQRHVRIILDKRVKVNLLIQYELVKPKTRLVETRAGQGVLVRKLSGVTKNRSNNFRDI